MAVRARQRGVSTNVDPVLGAVGDGELTRRTDVEFLFGSHGRVVAFRHGVDVFDLDLGWLGSAPWNDGDVFDPAGRYLGTITPTGRLYEIEARRGLTSPPPPAPSVGLRPGPPARREWEPLAAGMRDIRPRVVVPAHELVGGVDRAPALDPGRPPVLPTAVSSESTRRSRSKIHARAGGPRVAG